MMVAKSGSLSLKQPVKVYPVFFSQGVSFDFLWEAKGKSTLRSIQAFNCRSPFSVC